MAGRAEQFVPAGAGDFESGFTNPPTGLDSDAEYTGLQTQIGEAESKLAAKESLADAQEHALLREGVTPYEAARFTGELRENAKAATGELKILRARQAEIAPPARTTAATSVGEETSPGDDPRRAYRPWEGNEKKRVHTPLRAARTVLDANLMTNMRGTWKFSGAARCKGFPGTCIFRRTGRTRN